MLEGESEEAREKGHHLYDHCSHDHLFPPDAQNLDHHSRGPNITAFQIIMLSGLGLPEIPIGGSEANRLKSRMRRRLACVD